MRTSVLAVVLTSCAMLAAACAPAPGDDPTKPVPWSVPSEGAGTQQDLDSQAFAPAAEQSPSH